MNLKIIFLLFILCPNFSVVIAQNTLKDIVLTYDLNRRATPGNGQYDIDKPQLVHIEPICENQDSFGNFCAIMLDLNLTENPYKGSVKLVHQYDSKKYFSIDSAQIIDGSNATNLSDYILHVWLSKGTHAVEKIVKIKSDDFQIHLGGKRMDVDVTINNPDCKICKERREGMGDPQEAKPWVCRFVFE